MHRKILVPVDGSAPSRLALLEAIELVKNSSATLRLVHVVDEFVMDGAYIPGVYYGGMLASLRDAGQKVLDEAESLVREHAVQASSILLETVGHRVADQVVAEAKRWSADLIVMGTHGRRGLRRLLMGSDAELVVRTAPVPVLLVRAEPQPA